MSFLDRIEPLHVADLGRFRPFLVEGLRIGRVRHDVAERLAGMPETFEVSADALRLSPRLDDPDARTRAVADACRRLQEDDLLAAPRDEAFAVVRRWGDTPLFLLDRGAVTLFGVRAFGVHLNGFVRRADGFHLWVARRSTRVHVEPGALDHLVAGGQPHGLTLSENLAKECAEEAAIPADLAAQAVSTGAIRYRMETSAGFKDDTLFLYDLELPEAFTPRNTDGEVDAFELWPAERVMARVRDTDDFKFNVGAVLVDFFVRHGLLGPDDPEFLGVVSALGR